MRQFHHCAWLLAAIIALLTSGVTQKLAATPSDSPPATVISDLAPADEYFGHTHLSIVRLHHQVFILKDRIHHGASPDPILHESNEINDAYLDWAHRFPKDTWLPRMGWELATLYEELPGSAARVRAITLLGFLRDTFRSSSFASASQRELARGVGIRPWPLGSTADSRVVAHATVSLAPSEITDASALLLAIRSLQAQAARNQVNGETLKTAEAIEVALRSLSHEGTDAHYSASSWEMAALYQYIPGEQARDDAIRMLAFVLDRYPKTNYGSWSLRDLKRGVGVR